MFARIWILTVFFLASAQAVLAYDVAIKSTTNRDDTQTGDYWIGEDFAKGFEELGLSVVVDYRGEYNRVHQPEPKINLYMRGYTQFEPPLPRGINILYSYYPMAYHDTSAQKIDKSILNARAPMPKDSALVDDWQNYDILAVASKSYAKKLNDLGIKAVYIPQFTNPSKFFPHFHEDLQTDILFVGSNWHDRTSLRYALESGFTVAVYGFNWYGIIPNEMYKGQYIANDDLNKYYSSAKIVLNDHRPDMKEFGFINNRIYDATAAGALVISDYMPEIEEIYGDTVPMYQTKEELTELLTYYLSHEMERKQKAEAARQITLKYFTNTEIAKTVMETVKDAQLDSSH